MILNLCPFIHDLSTKRKKMNFLWYHKKFNPPCTITHPEIYPEFKIHLSTLTHGLNAHKYGNLNYWTHLHACYKRQKLTILCKYIGYYMTKNTVNKRMVWYCAKILVIWKKILRNDCNQNILQISSKVTILKKNLSNSNFVKKLLEY